MKLKREHMTITVRPLTKSQIARIADALHHINLYQGAGVITNVDIHSVASGRISGTATREIPISRTDQIIEAKKFTVRAGVLRFIGEQRKL